MVRLTLLAAAALALSACGVRGDLERPPPLWGNPEFDADASDVSDVSPEDLLEEAAEAEQADAEDAPHSPDR